MFKPKIHHQHELDSIKDKKGSGIQHHGLSAQTYYWIVAENEERRVIYGCKNTMQEAEMFKAKINDASASVIPLPTRDPNAAREMLRGRTLDKTGSINQSFKKNSWKAYGE